MWAAAVVLATTRADVNGVIRKHLDVRKISFAPMATAVERTGMEYGGITPAGLPPEWPVLVDRAVVDAGLVVIGSGLRRSKVLLEGTAVAVAADGDSARPHGESGRLNDDDTSHERAHRRPARPRRHRGQGSERRAARPLSRQLGDPPQVVGDGPGVRCRPRVGTAAAPDDPRGPSGRRDARRGGHRRDRHLRPDLGVRPVGRHRQLPVPVGQLRGQRRRRGRRRWTDRRRAGHGARRTLDGGPRPRCAVQRPGPPLRAPGAGGNRAGGHRFRLRPGPKGKAGRDHRPPAARHPRHPPDRRVPHSTCAGSATAG